MSLELEDALISRFIARPDAVAQQASNGDWHPLREFNRETQRYDGPLVGWSRDILRTHLSGSKTYGHYMLDQNNFVQLIAFDIDLKQRGILPFSYDENGYSDFAECDLRQVWADRLFVTPRTYIKTQFRTLSSWLAAITWKELEIPVATAFSGNKGVHVYGFTGPIQASDARLGGNLVMETTQIFKLTRGSFEWSTEEADFNIFTIEVFPKQDEQSGFGNLMALPLGVNQKAPENPKMFLDLCAPMNEFRPVDPLRALTTTNPWE